VDAFGKESIFPVYENQGRVWQAEEGLVGGKWQRFFGFVGAHCIARAPAAEIDFPAKWPWNELDNGFDCRLASDADRVKNPLSPGQPFLLTLELRNRRGIDQPAPDTLYNAATKALASGVELHLYRKTEPAPGELVPEAQDLRKRASNWAEVPPNGEPAHFNLVSSLHALAPTEAREVMSFNLADFYDLRAAGQYVVEIHFDLKSLKFTGGESNSRAFSIK
jgi:hypothetical protein